MYYVYLLKSLVNLKKTYIGMTDNVQIRLEMHNEGRCPFTSRYRPWELVAFVAVKSKAHAVELERYFKSGSGHAFAHKHLW